jgi:phosphoserine phosphatase
MLNDQSFFSIMLGCENDAPAAAAAVRRVLDEAEVGVIQRHFEPGRSLKLVASHPAGFDRSPLIPLLKKAAREAGLAYAIYPDLAEPPEFRFAIMDMDSTLIDQEVIEELADFAGVREHVARVTTLAMEGKLDFQEALRERVKLLEGQPESILIEVLERRIKATDGLDRLLEGFRKRGMKTAVVSGGFTPVVAEFARRRGLDHALANNLEVANGKLTGQVVGEIVDAEVKKRTLLELAREYHVDPKQAVAIGDGANDLKMMSVAGLGVAFCAKPIVQETALAAVNRRRLDDVLWLMG